jgi:hypothetical protein
MEPEDSDPGARYRHLEPPIPLDQMIESVDAGQQPDSGDAGYRDQEWLIRNALA